MTWLRGVRILFLKEFQNSFKSPLTYVLAALYGMIMGWLFFNYLAAHREITEQSLWQFGFGPSFW